jgi:molybdopterin biosynthesis enzyme
MSNLKPQWRKSSYSVNDGACVEVATFTRMPKNADPEFAVQVRHSKKKDLMVLKFEPEAWSLFTAMVAADFYPLTLAE